MQKKSQHALLIMQVAPGTLSLFVTAAVPWDYSPTREVSLYDCVSFCILTVMKDRDSVDPPNKNTVALLQ